MLNTFFRRPSVATQEDSSSLTESVGLPRTQDEKLVWAAKILQDFTRKNRIETDNLGKYENYSYKTLVTYKRVLNNLAIYKCKQSFIEYFS